MASEEASPQSQIPLLLLGCRKNYGAHMNKHGIGSKLGPDQPKETVAAFDEISAKLVHLICNIHLQHCRGWYNMYHI